MLLLRKIFSNFVHLIVCPCLLVISVSAYSGIEYIFHRKGLGLIPHHLQYPAPYHALAGRKAAKVRKGRKRKGLLEIDQKLCMAWPYLHFICVQGNRNSLQIHMMPQHHKEGAETIISNQDRKIIAKMSVLYVSLCFLSFYSLLSLWNTCISL